MASKYVNLSVLAECTKSWPCQEIPFGLNNVQTEPNYSFPTPEISVGISWHDVKCTCRFLQVFVKKNSLTDVSSKKAQTFQPNKLDIIAQNRDTRSLDDETHGLWTTFRPQDGAILHFNSTIVYRTLTFWPRDN